VNIRLCFAFAFWACSSAAGAAAELSEDLYLADMPMVLTASRIEQSALDAPAPVTVIDRETIRASGLVEIHDLMRLVPGFQVADWARGGPVVANHGLSDVFSRRMLVLVDGFSLVDAAFGTIHWQDLPIHVEDIERIEVVRGPNQASFGANAYQGVVNIVTRRAGEDIGGEAVMAYGGRDYANLYANHSGQMEKLEWRASASSRQATTFRDLNRAGYEYGERVARQTLNAQFVYHRAGDTEWRGSLGLSRGRDEVGSTIDGAAYPNHESKNRNLFMQLGWHRYYASESEISLRYAHSGRSESEPYLYRYGPFSSPVDFAIDTQRDDLEYQQIHAFSDDLKGVWGAGLRREQMESARYFHGIGEIEGRQWQAFGNLDWRLAPAWRLHVGGMLEDHYNTDTLFSPRLALNYYVGPLQSVRVSAGRGYRAPSMLEAGAREAFVYKGAAAPPYLAPGDVVDLGNWADADLAPERLDFWEAGYIGRFPELRLEVDARVYEERHDDYINTVTCAVAPRLDPNLLACAFPSPPGYVPIQQGLGGSDDKAYSFTNAGKNRVRGAEASFDWRHPLLGRFLLAHAITQVDSWVNDANTRKDAARSAPLHATSLLWSKAFASGFTGAVGVYRVGEMKWMGGGDDQKGYTRLDLRLAKRLGDKDGTDEIALTVQNLNGSHVEFRDVATVERQAFVTLRLGWQ